MGKKLERNILQQMKKKSSEPVIKRKERGTHFATTPKRYVKEGRKQAAKCGWKKYEGVNNTLIMPTKGNTSSQKHK